MRAFDYARASDAAEAVGSDAKLLAGGTNLLDLMKLEVETPAQVLDINRVGLNRIEPEGDGLRIGALVTNSDCAADPRVRKDWPLLAQAILAGASPQLRNKATMAGNLCQRTRCMYFMRTDTRCNKREPGSGCDALEGVNRNHAILGASETCIATYPGDMAVALAALDAWVEIEGPSGRRSVALREFHRLPNGIAHRDNVLEPGEIITAITLPAPVKGRQLYRKVRERSSYAFALVSIAAVVRMDADRIGSASLAFGGLAHKPWTDPAVAETLVGQKPTPELFDKAADALLAKAVGWGENDFKIPLARRTLAAVLHDATKG